MRIIVLGLSITSSWGNGHATTYRALLRELGRRGHNVLFLEREQLWYAKNRDQVSSKDYEVELYSSVVDLKRYSQEIAEADCVMVGSYVPEGIIIGEWVLRMAGGLTLFYDIDTPITLEGLSRKNCDYISHSLIERYDGYLSFTGGPILSLIRQKYGSPMVYPFYCSVDPSLYFPEDLANRWDLGYLGTYSFDRQPILEESMLQTAGRLASKRFVVAGPQYPASIAWPSNVERIEHLSPSSHRHFYNSQTYTLNVTRGEMTRAGWSPSVRLFEAAACGVPIISDCWEGLDHFFEPGREILLARSSREVCEILQEMPETERRAIGNRARCRVLASHTAMHRAAELEKIIYSGRKLARDGGYLTRDCLKFA